MRPVCKAEGKSASTKGKGPRTVLQNLRKPDQIYPNVLGLLFASCFNEAAQGNKAWFSLEHSPEWGILQWRTNPIFPQVSRPLHRLTRWNSPPKTRYSKMGDTVKSHGLPRKPHHFGEICIDLERNHENSCNPFLGLQAGISPVFRSRATLLKHFGGFLRRGEGTEEHTSSPILSTG